MVVGIPKSKKRPCAVCGKPYKPSDLKMCEAYHLKHCTECHFSSKCAGGRMIAST